MIVTEYAMNDRKYVHFPSCRFECPHCKRPFTESLSWVESKRQESTAYELHV